MAIQGLRTTDDIIGQYKDRPENWRMGVLMLDPNGSAPLYALTSMMETVATDDPTFHWFEEELPNYRVVLSADIDDAVTAIPLASGATYFKEGDLVRVEQTDELLMVTANPVSDTSITVSRGFAGSTATLVDFDGAGINPNLMLIGSAYEEGSDAPEGRSYLPTEHDNNTQIFRDTFEITNTDVETEMRTGDTVKEDKRKCLTRHSMGIEKSMIFGRKSVTMKNGRPRRTMDGIIAQIPTDNVAVPSAGTWDMTEIEDYLRMLFTFGSNEKICFGGNRFMLGVQQIVRKNSAYQLAPVSTEYGMKVTRFITPFGTLVLKTHPLFNQMSSGVTAATAYRAVDSWGLIIDAKYIKYRPLRNRDTKYEPSLQEPGKDGKQAGYITEAGIQVAHPKTFGLIKGLTAGVTDA